MNKILLSLAFLSSSAFASVVPEYFFQPEEGKTIAEGALNYTITELEFRGSNNDTDNLSVDGSVIYGLTHSLALELGIGQDKEKTKVTGQPSVTQNGLTEIVLNFIGHTSMSETFRIHWGLRSSLTPNKSGASPFWNEFHTFTPYAGFSMNMSESMMLGAEFQYDSIHSDDTQDFIKTTTNGGISVGDNYTASVFTEKMLSDKKLLGARLAYSLQGSDDDLYGLGLYGRFQIAENMKLLPSLTYARIIEDRNDFDSQFLLLASLGLRYHF